MKLLRRLRLRQLLLLCGLLPLWQPAAAELVIEITRGHDQPVPIAVVPFARKGAAVPAEDIAAVVAADLARSGRFALLARNSLLSAPGADSRVFFNEWRQLRVDYLLAGNVADGPDNTFEIRYVLYDVLRQRLLREGHESGPVAQLRDMAHAVSDAAYEAMTGTRGIFSTRIAYILKLDDAQSSSGYRLMVADADGARERVLLASKQPLLSPAWSPDGSEIAYVSLEEGYPAVYRQHLDNGTRQRLLPQAAFSSAPAWSPDGRRIALALAERGNVDIYVLELKNGTLRRLTRHFGIDTEPAWTPGGDALIFTSDRSGTPQIYRVALAAGTPQRLTFQGSYNARAAALPEGGMVFVNGDKGSYRIALQRAVAQRTLVLTETRLDESPAVSPNGAMVMYATHHKGQGVLVVISLDSGTAIRLSGSNGRVTDPAWSPFLDGAGSRRQR